MDLLYWMQIRRKEVECPKNKHHQDAVLVCLAVEINPQSQLTQNKMLNKEGLIKYGMIRKMQK